MHWIDNMIDRLIEKMSPEEKEALAEKALTKFFDELTPESKQQLIEKMLPKLFEGVDQKELLTDLMKTMWKSSGASEAPAKLMSTMSKMASDTKEKITDLPSKIKKML